MVTTRCLDIVPCFWMCFIWFHLLCQTVFVSANYTGSIRNNIGSLGLTALSLAENIFYNPRKTLNLPTEPAPPPKEGELIHVPRRNEFVMVPLGLHKEFPITISKSSALACFISYSLFSVMRRRNRIMASYGCCWREHLYCYGARSKLPTPFSPPPTPRWRGASDLEWIVKI